MNSGMMRILLAAALALACNLAPAAAQQQPPQAEPATVVAVPSAETRAAAAGWGKGTWLDQHERCVATARAGGIDLVLLGDSITQGWGGPTRSVGTIATTKATAHFAGLRTANMGISGDRTQHVLWRLDQGALGALAGPQNAVKVCVVIIGTNNSNGSDNTAEEIGAGIAAIVRRLRTGLPQAKVLLLDVFPRGEKPNPQRQKNAKASDLAAAAFAGDAMVRRLDLAPQFLQADGTLSKETMPDLLHLAPAAYRTWAEAMAPVVDELRR